MSAHTPTPWHTTYSSEDATFITDDHGKSIAVIPEDGGTPENIANAAYIVKCVNAHEELVEALREIAKGAGPYSQDQLEHATNTIQAMKDLANEAIARAEGK